MPGNRPADSMPARATDTAAAWEESPSVCHQRCSTRWSCFRSSGPRSSRPGKWRSHVRHAIGLVPPAWRRESRNAWKPASDPGWTHHRSAVPRLHHWLRSRPPNGCRTRPPLIRLNCRAARPSNGALPNRSASGCAFRSWRTEDANACGWECRPLAVRIARATNARSCLCLP